MVDRDKIIRRLRSVLMPFAKEGASLKKLRHEYEEMFPDEKIPYRDLGYRDLLSFLQGTPECCYIRPDPEWPGDVIIFPIASAETAHVQALVAKSRPSGKKKTKKRPTFTAHRYGVHRTGQPGYSMPPAYRRTPLLGAAPNRTCNYGLLGNMPKIGNMPMMDIRKPSLMGAMPTNGLLSRPVTAAQAPWIPAAHQLPKSNSSRLSVQPTAAKKTGTSAPPSVSGAPALPACKLSWEEYGKRLLQILGLFPNGLYQKRCEKLFMEKYRERLPEDWVDQLEGRIINISGCGDTTLVTVMPSAVGNSANSGRSNPAQSYASTGESDSRSSDDVDRTVAFSNQRLVITAYSRDPIGKNTAGIAKPVHLRLEDLRLDDTGIDSDPDVSSDDASDWEEEETKFGMKRRQAHQNHASVAAAVAAPNNGLPQKDSDSDWSDEELESKAVIESQTASSGQAVPGRQATSGGHAATGVKAGVNSCPAGDSNSLEEVELRNRIGQVLYSYGLEPSYFSDIQSLSSTSCSCLREEGIVLCSNRGCNSIMLGRTAVECPIHPGVYGPRDYGSCIQCHSTNLSDLQSC